MQNKLGFENVYVADYQGADYNPRFLSEASKSNLIDSIRRLGFILPIIVNEHNHIIVAGHQRTKVAKILGISEVPAFKLTSVRKADEVFFNQLHNELERNSLPIYAKVTINEAGYVQLPPEVFDITRDNTNARNIMGISRLILRYGNIFLTIIADGQAVYYQDYLAACKKLGLRANCYVAPSELAEDVKECFSRSYGVYDYSNLERSTWVQGKAQLNRKASERDLDRKIRRNVSMTYERLVLKMSGLKKLRCLDFGCGKGEYLSLLQEKGVRAFGIEFYNYTGHGTLDIMKSIRQINAVAEDIRKNGQFDVVVCDSVLNSVDCQEAEQAVMRTITAFCKMGGRVFISGRMATAERYKKRSASQMSEIHFIDENGFTGHLRLGEWYYQKFHTKEQIEKLIEVYGLEPLKLEIDVNTWRLSARKISELPKSESIKGINYEFSLPYPGGRYNKAQQMLKALKLC